MQIESARAQTAEQERSALIQTLVTIRQDRQSLSDIGFSRNGDSINQKDLLQELWDKAKAENAVFFSLVSPLDQNPGPKYQPYFNLKKNHDLMFVLDLEAAQNSLEFQPNTER